MIYGNRIGRVKISERLLRSHWQDLSLMFSNFVPVQIIEHLDTQVLEYLGYSTLFDELPDATAAPEYRFIFDENKIPAEIRVKRIDPRLEKDV